MWYGSYKFQLFYLIKVWCLVMTSGNWGNAPICLLSHQTQLANLRLPFWWIILENYLFHWCFNLIFRITKTAKGKDTHVISSWSDERSFLDTPCKNPPLSEAHQASLSITNSQSPLTHVHWVGDIIQPSHPLSSPSLPASIFSSIRVFSNESALHIQKR